MEFPGNSTVRNSCIFDSTKTAATVLSVIFKLTFFAISLSALVLNSLLTYACSKVKTFCPNFQLMLSHFSIGLALMSFIVAMIIGSDLNFMSNGYKSVFNENYCLVAFAIYDLFACATTLIPFGIGIERLICVRKFVLREKITTRASAIVSLCWLGSCIDAIWLFVEAV